MSLILENMDIIAYPITSNGIWRFIPHRGELSHKVKLSSIKETEMWDKSQMLDRYFILSKGMLR